MMQQIPHPSSAAVLPLGGDEPKERLTNADRRSAHRSTAIEDAAVTVLNVRHTTVYRYSRPVVLGDHRLMLRPRDSHDLRLIKTNLTSRRPRRCAGCTMFSAIRSRSHLYSEPIGRVAASKADLLLETYAAERPPFEITPEALRYPFVYSADDRIDLGRMLERQYPDPTIGSAPWARSFVRSNPTDTSALLADLNNGVAAQISYQSRETEGTQTPIETLTAAGAPAAISPSS